MDWKQYGDGSIALYSDIEGMDLARFGGPKTLMPGGNPNVPGGQPNWRGQKQQKFAIAGGVDTAGGILSIVPQEPVALLINEVLIYVTTASTGACSLSAGATATPGTLSNNLIDTLSVAAAGLFDNYTDKGTNGKTRGLLLPGQSFTISTASGASAGLVGTVILGYILA